jgi:DNA-binding NarL/FixJ family response regulator
MLGEDLERNITDAWLRLRPKILADPQELHRRLARRRGKSLRRAVRAWCIAIRASDRRITPAHWVIVPEHAMEVMHPEHPYEPIEHEVRIQYHAIRRYCHPVCISGEDAEDVAKMLGVSYRVIQMARKQGVFSERFLSHLGGKRGRPIPLLSNGGKLMDPSHGNFFERPHPIWGGAWEFLNREVPEDFEQTVVRRPVFRQMRGKGICPSEEGNTDDMQFLRWNWVCPKCGKEVQTIYFPLPVRTLFDYGEFDDPVIELKLSDADLPWKPEEKFACGRCHRVYHFSSIAAGAWNEVIAYLTAGMLYGCEVERPALFVPERKRTRVRILNCEAPVRRKVLTRLRNGWSTLQIARDLGKTTNNVRGQARKICLEEGVGDVHALAEKLQFAVSPPFNRLERAGARRFAVKEMLVRDCTQKEMMERLGIDFQTLVRDVNAIYKMHGIKSGQHGGRRELAEKVGVVFVSRRDEVRERVKEMGERGMSRLEIAREMGVSLGVVKRYRREIKRGEMSARPCAVS